MEYIDNFDKLVDAICEGKSVVSVNEDGKPMINPEWLDKHDDSQVRFDSDTLARTDRIRNKRGLCNRRLLV